MGISALSSCAVAYLEYAVADPDQTFGREVK